MITHIRMKNFKSWQDSPKVELAPLTGFFGTNSSGKSSLLQMLLLLKQTVEHTDTEEVIFFGDENSLVNLGSFREVIHGHKLGETLGLEFGWKIDTPLTIEAHFENSLGYYEETSVTTDRIMFNASILWHNDGLVVEGNPYRVKYGNTEAIAHGGNHSKKLYGEPYWSGSTNSPVIQLSSEFVKLFSGIYYLGPTRVHPQRIYHWEQTHPKEIDMWGNKAVDALLSARVRQLTVAQNDGHTSIEKRISTWFRKMELAHSFQLVPSGNLDNNNYEIRFQKSPNSTEVTLTDMGHGVAESVPFTGSLLLCTEGVNINSGAARHPPPSEGTSQPCGDTDRGSHQTKNSNSDRKP